MAALEDTESRNEGGWSESGISAAADGCTPQKSDRAPRTEKPKKEIGLKREYEVTLLMRRDRYYYDTMTVEAYSAAHAVVQVVNYIINHTDTDWDGFEFKGVSERKAKRR